jgi:hypothetical protein
MGEWKYSFTILDLGTRWGKVANVTALPLCTWVNRLPYTFDRRKSGTQKPVRMLWRVE